MKDLQLNPFDNFGPISIHAIRSRDNCFNPIQDERFSSKIHRARSNRI